MTNDERYGPPAIQIDGLRVWVYGYEYGEAQDAWDGNWLRVTAHCAESGASVVVSGTILDTVSFARFHRELTAVYERLEGAAILESLEPELKVEVRAVGAAGRIELCVDITPDQLRQSHRFFFELDQSYLPDVLRACERLLEQYPVRDAAARGV